MASPSRVAFSAGFVCLFFFTEFRAKLPSFFFNEIRFPEWIQQNGFFLKIFIYLFFKDMSTDGPTGPWAAILFCFSFLLFFLSTCLFFFDSVAIFLNSFFFFFFFSFFRASRCFISRVVSPLLNGLTWSDYIRLSAAFTEFLQFFILRLAPTASNFSSSSSDCVFSFFFLLEKKKFFFVSFLKLFFFFLTSNPLEKMSIF